MPGTKIKKCSCENKYQDEKYGKGMRVHNWSPKNEWWKCTVCGRTRKENQ